MGTEFTEQYEAQEKQDEEQQLAREHNIEVAEQQIKKREAARAEAKKNTAYLEKQNEAMRKSQPKLRADVKAIVDKFDEFRDSVTGSNERHADCKTEIESLRDELQELERVNSDLKKCPRLATMQQEQQEAQKQRIALDKLCKDLESQNRKLEAQ